MFRNLFDKLLRVERVASVAPYHEKPKPDLAKAPEAKPLPPITHPDRFPACLAIILKHEGGYVNHKLDPGGRTNLGVTQRVWEDWRDMPATEAIMRSLTPEKVAPLYRARYWDKVRGPDLAPGLDLCVFDAAVNKGPRRAIILLQRELGVSADGVIGPKTLAAAKDGGPDLIKRYQEARRRFYRGLKTFPVFGKGWLRRVADVEKEALSWAS